MGEVGGERRCAAGSAEAADTVFKGWLGRGFDCAILPAGFSDWYLLGGGADLAYSAYNLGAASTFAHHVARAFAHLPAGHADMLAAGTAQ